ncbi:hypothetical protein QVD17_30407 [Tagetes erecta]|uniref:Uncharacterized protein n=1 Tax=Tagetes erecta TaxID=13708 RepID=A0AAD8K2N9_TARER|nr:hypothetical protein QVD17_30407 [Tagetes erecta]
MPGVTLVFSHTEAGGSCAGADADERMKRMVEEQDHFLESGGLREFVDDLIDDDADVDEAEISRLQEENKVQGRCITELQSMVGVLLAKLLDLSQRLEAKLRSDFVSAQTQAEIMQSPFAGAATERETNQSATKASRSPVRTSDKFEDIMNTLGMRSYFDSGSRVRRRITKPKHKVPLNIVMKRKGRSLADKHSLGKDRYIMKPAMDMVTAASEKAKVIPLPAYLHDGSLSDFKYWCFDPVQSEAVIICGNVEYRVKDTSELMRFGESDIKFFSSATNSSRRRL